VTQALRPLSLAATVRDAIDVREQQGRPVGRREIAAILAAAPEDAARLILCES
jgi:hypothetical protein